MKRFTLLLALSLCLVSVLPMSAQQAPQYSLYMFNKYLFNPAYGGMENSLSATGVFRKQWVGLEGSPLTQNLNAHLPWYYLSGGAGLSIENDILGAERNTTMTLSYNYIQPLGQKADLSIGIGAGFIQKVIDGSKLRAPDGDYEGNTINHNDDFIPEGKESAIAPAFNAGVYFRSELFELGFSAVNLIEPSAKYNLGSVTNIDFSRSFYLYFSYNFFLGERVMLQPAILVKSDVVQTQLDFSSLVRYNGNIFAGASIRGYSKNSLDALVIFGGMDLTKNVTIAYGYDYSLSGLRSVNSGSHEVIVKYNLRKKIGGKVPSKIIFNPRYY